LSAAVLEIHSPVGSIIPVDFVADYVIVGTAYWAGKGLLEVMHIGSSLRNPVTWKLSKDCVLEYWNQNVPKLKVSNCNVVIRKSVLYYDLYNKARALPAMAYRGLANLT
jgi:hypothetical protein